MFDFYNRYDALKANVLAEKNTKIVVLGHQKSGTTVVGNLIAKAANMTFANDPIFHTDRDGFNVVRNLASDYLEFKKHIYQNKKLFFKEVVKDPDFSLHVDKVMELYPNKKYVYVARNPYDIVRSIFNRLGVDGSFNGSKLEEQHISNPTKHWMYLLNGTKDDGISVVERLCTRIEMCTKLYKSYSDSIYLVRYEDFKSQKKKVIEQSVRDLGFQVRSNISPLLEHQFQPKGTSFKNVKDFFDEDNYELIKLKCSETLKAFSY